MLEDDDVDSTLIERKVLALGTKHPYLCHLFCTFQTEVSLRSSSPEKDREREREWDPETQRPSALLVDASR